MKFMTQIAGIRLKAIKSQLANVPVNQKLVEQLAMAGKSYQLPVIQAATKTIAHGYGDEDYNIIWGAEILKAAEVAYAEMSDNGGHVQVIKLEIDEDASEVLAQMEIDLEPNHSDANRIEELEAKLNQIKELLG